MASTVSREIRVFSYGAAVPAAQRVEVKSTGRDDGPESEGKRQDGSVSSDAVMADADGAEGEKATDGRLGKEERGSDILDDDYYEFTAEDYARLMGRKKKPGESQMMSFCAS